MINFIKQILGFGNKTDYAQLIKDGAIIVDVRTPGEYAGGHIKNSINIPLNTLDKNLNKLKNKDKPIITCCASGMRSASAKQILINKGYNQVINGGGWQSLNNKIS